MSNKNNIEKRAIEEAKYIIDTNSTIRAAAEVFGVSKSTVHTDIQKRLIEIDRKLYDEVSKVIDVNLQERAVRGGKAAREMYKRLKKLELLNTVKE